MLFDMTFLIFTALTVGLIYLVTQSVILYPLRKFIADRGTFLEIAIYCPACSGFWIGVALSAAGYWLRQDVLGAVEAGVTACGLGALWGVYGPDGVWAQERGYDSTQEKKDE